MKRIFTSMLLLSVLMMSSGSHGQNESPVLEGSYLGQKPPGSIPEAFAPGTVTTEYQEFNGLFSPDMKEFYLIRQDPETNKYPLVVIEYKNNQWREAVVMPSGVGGPFISPDGKTMHLGRRYMERTEAGWSELKSLGAPFKDINIMRLSVSRKGTIYFDTFDPKSKNSPMRYSRLIDGKYEKPKELRKEINAGDHPFIAPDESYLIWDSRREGGYGRPDLYISFRQQDGSWGAAINMGDKINTAAGEIDANVTPDGKYLFFDRQINDKTTNIFWVDAQIIETLRPKP